jgi:hypothetical protein
MGRGRRGFESATDQKGEEELIESGALVGMIEFVMALEYW